MLKNTNSIIQSRNGKYFQNIHIRTISTYLLLLLFSAYKNRIFTLLSYNSYLFQKTMTLDTVQLSESKFFR